MAFPDEQGVQACVSHQLHCRIRPATKATRSSQDVFADLDFGFQHSTGASQC